MKFVFPLQQQHDDICLAINNFRHKMNTNATINK